MTRFMPILTGRPTIGVAALALLLVACSGSGGTTKTPKEEDEDDGTGTRGVGGRPDPAPKPDPNDNNKDDKGAQPNTPTTPPPDDDNSNPDPTTIDQKPTGFSLDLNSRRFFENTDTSSRIELATIKITDDGVGENTITLSDIVRFVEEGGKLYLKPNINLDYETATGHKHEVTLTLSATGTGTLPAPITFTLHITNIDEAPVLTISGSQTLSLNEGITVTPTDTGFVVTATDPDAGDSITLSISDNRFEIIGGRLQVKSGQTFDFETEPNVQVVVTASSNGKTVQQTMTLQVTNIDEVGRVADFSTTPVVGEKLFPPQITDPDSLTIIKNQWQVLENGVWVEKSTDDGYIPAPADVGKQIQLIVTYRDAIGEQTLTTNPSAAVIEATQSLFTNAQTAIAYLAEAIPYPAGHKLASFDLKSEAEVQSVAISLQDEAGLVGLQKIGSRYEIILSKEKEFDFETEARSGNYKYDFTVTLTKTNSQTQDIGFSLPFKNGFGPSDKGANDITPQQFNTIDGLWYPLPDNTPSNMRQTTFDARKPEVLERMALEGGYDPSFLFYWGNRARD